MSTVATFTNLVPSATYNSARVIRYPDLFEKIMKEVLREDSYEEHENYDKPNVLAVMRASGILGDAINSADLRHIEVDPYLGEIHITWRNRQLGRQVKAIFSRDDRTISLYHEQMRQGRVLNHDIIPNVGAEALNFWVNWVYRGQ